MRGVLEELVLANGSRILIPNRKAIQNSKGEYKEALTSRGWGAVSECGLWKPCLRLLWNIQTVSGHPSHWTQHLGPKNATTGFRRVGAWLNQKAHFREKELGSDSWADI